MKNIKYYILFLSLIFNIVLYSSSAFSVTCTGASGSPPTIYVDSPQYRTGCSMLGYAVTSFNGYTCQSGGTYIGIYWPSSAGSPIYVGSGSSVSTASESCQSGSNPCSFGKTQDSSGQCVCPSGTVDNGLGQCVSKPPDCTLQEYNAATQGCSSESSSGWSQHVCWDSISNSSLVVPACDPSCGSGQHLENHACVANPTCVGDQTYNYSLNICDEPVCSGQQTLDAQAHVCHDPNCSAGQLLCGHVCYLASECATGYVELCDASDSATAAPHCTFNGCPPEYTQGFNNGFQVCLKNSVISGQVTNNTSQTVNNNSTTTSNTVVNPDGSLTTNSSSSGTTTINNTTTTEVKMDTTGLAQESTLQSLLDKLGDILGKLSSFFGSPSDYNGDLPASSGGEGGDGSSDAEAEDFLRNGNDYFDDLFDVSEWVPDIEGSSNCGTSIPIVFKNYSYDFAPCSKLQPLREVLAWTFYVLAAFNIFKIWFSIKD